MQPPLQLPPAPPNKAWNTASHPPAHESWQYDIVQRRRPDSQHPLSNLFIRSSTSSAPPPSTFLLSPKKNGPVCFTRSRRGAWRRDKTIISLTAAARAGAPAADRILKQAAVLTQIGAQARPHISTLWTVSTSHYGGRVQAFPPHKHWQTQTDFHGCWVSMSDAMYPVLGTAFVLVLFMFLRLQKNGSYFTHNSIHQQQGQNESYLFRVWSASSSLLCWPAKAANRHVTCKIVALKFFEATLTCLKYVMRFLKCSTAASSSLFCNVGMVQSGFQDSFSFCQTVTAISKRDVLAFSSSPVIQFWWLHSHCSFILLLVAGRWHRFPLLVSVKIWWVAR